MLLERSSEVRLQKSLNDQNRSDSRNGYPIRLNSKPLSILVDENEIYIAQNGFITQSLDLKVSQSIKSSTSQTEGFTELNMYIFGLNRRLGR